MNTTPKVSVVMSVYNGERYLKQAMDSILAQTFKDFELILINDGSTDGTKKIIDSYDDYRLKIISRPNKGLVASLNEGIAAARGKYIARHDADDYSSPDRFTLQVEALDKNPDWGLVATNVIEVDADEKITSRFTLYDSLRYGSLELMLLKANPIAHGSVMMRKSILTELGGYKKSSWPSEDYDLWVRFAAKSRLGKIDQQLYYYRLNEEGISFSNEDLRRITSEKARSIASRISTINQSGSYYYRTQLERLQHIKRLLKLKQFNAVGRIILKTKIQPPIHQDGNRDILHISLANSLGGGEVNIRNLVKGMGSTWNISVAAPGMLLSVMPLRVPTFELYVPHYMDNRVLYKIPGLRYLIYRFILYLSLPRNHYSLIHTHQFDQDFLNALPRNTINLLTAHTRYRFGADFEPIALRSLQRLNAIASVAVATQQDLLKLGVSASKLHLLTNGTDVGGLEDLSSRRKRSTVVWVGRIEEADKNPRLFVEIARKALSENINLKFEMYGDGKLLPEIKKIVSADHLSNISLKGFTDNKLSIYDKALALCITSTTEAMPLVAIEAMSAGVPVISTDVGDVGRMVEKNKAGRIVGPNADEYIGVIGDLAKNHKKYYALAYRAQELYKDHYRLDTMCENTAKLYMRMINENTR